VTDGLPAPLQPLPGAPSPGRSAAEARLRALGVEPRAWSNGPGDSYAAHEHTTTKLLVCVEGSIVFEVGPEAVAVELVAGDGFILPAGTEHAALVGPRGCTCLEGHRPAG
jgi:uncharacterized protein YjlB